jgi:hypothetical protein
MASRIKIRVNTKDLKEFSKGLHDTIDYQKVLNTFMNGLTSHITQKHGRRFSYNTPTIGYRSTGKGFSGNTNRGQRQNMRKRSGKLMEAIRSAKFVKAAGRNNYEAGYNLSTILSIAPYAKIHLNHDITGKVKFTTLKPRKSKYFTIPLNAATDSNGNLKVTPPKIVATYKLQMPDRDDDGPKRKVFVYKKRVAGQRPEDWVRMLYKNVQPGSNFVADFSEEDTTKFRQNSILLFKGGEKKPYFVLAKKIKIPNRLTLHKEIYEKGFKETSYYSLKYKLEREVVRLLKNLGKRR